MASVGLTKMSEQPRPSRGQAYSFMDDLGDAKKKEYFGALSGDNDELTRWRSALAKQMAKESKVRRRKVAMRQAERIVREEEERKRRAESHRDHASAGDDGDDDSEEKEVPRRPVPLDDIEMQRQGKRKGSVSLSGQGKSQSRNELAAGLKHTSSKASFNRRSSLSIHAAKLAAKPKEQSCLGYVDKLLSSNAFNVLIVVITIWAVFGADVQALFISSEYDEPIAYATIAIIALFLFELVALSLVHTSTYFLKFFFWMDFIALVSLVPDVLVVFYDLSSSPLATLTLARAGRAARIATRTARLARVVKFFELFMKKQRRGNNMAWLDRGDSAESGEIEEEAEVSEITDDLMQPSMVGQQVQDRMFKQIFFMILIMFIALSLLSPAGTFRPRLDEQAESNLGTLDALYPNQGAAVTFYMQQNNKDLVYLRFRNDAPLVNEVQRLDDLRPLEIFEVNCPTTAAGSCVAKFDATSEVREAAYLNLGLTIFVIVLLITSNSSLSGMVQEMLLRPIERMVAVVKLLALNPLATLKIREDFRFETGLLESMLSKIGVLLQIGFGAAGSSIISHNLSASGELVPMVAGRKIEAIFGFCDIRQFTDITEVLQEDVMIFVNQIAEIVHTAVCRHGGFPNKNIGDAFLLVWPLPNRERMSSDAFDLVASRIASDALTAFEEIVEELRYSPELCKMLERVPGHNNVRMGCGLHIGWSIVGAIGSRMKVDASYLSPNVNLSSRLEAATKQYGVEILLSNDVFDLLPQDRRDKCAHIDSAMMKGSKLPLGLYTPIPKYILDHEGDNSRQWRDAFPRGAEAYFSGDWETARRELTLAMEQRSDFVPARVLLDYMAKFDYRAPKDWAGHRKLTDK
eukprot:TRINITY_DN67807_c3_g13_i1.p1 TRINITY_DN67807_c3_g13~~TRINITY_DN67807_c3_g13_i1.p1  ORF type:complete len:860 (-),score=471.20 TRINITY_DN67807_c3_g13_i1:69-2648(-)